MKFEFIAGPPLRGEHLCMLGGRVCVSRASGGDHVDVGSVFFIINTTQ